MSAEPDFDIVGEAADGLEAVYLVTKLQPDILVLDLMMPGINGLEVTRQLSKKHLGTAILILSMHNDEAYIKEALYAGAKAYILKESPDEQLALMIREIAAGKPCYSSLR